MAELPRQPPLRQVMRVPIEDTPAKRRSLRSPGIYQGSAYAPTAPSTRARCPFVRHRHSEASSIPADTTGLHSRGTRTQSSPCPGLTPRNSACLVCDPRRPNSPANPFRSKARPVSRSLSRPTLTDPFAARSAGTVLVQFARPMAVLRCTHRRPGPRGPRVQWQVPPQRASGS